MVRWNQKARTLGGVRRTLDLCDAQPGPLFATTGQQRVAIGSCRVQLVRFGCCKLAASSKGVHERRAQGSALVQVPFDVEQSESCDDLLERNQRTRDFGSGPNWTQR